MRTIIINTLALRWCRVTTVAILALAWLLHMKELVVLGFALMLVPAVFSIRYSPVLFLVERIAPGRGQCSDAYALRFAQGLGAFLLGCALVHLYLLHTRHAGWMLVGVVAGSTAMGAAGYCVGAAIFQAMERVWLTLNRRLP